ncbi:MAG: T9SS type A sorting domain-containing protein, partial [Chlorobi bacterium]|nr:T9SS type A sorting domain-containing protein [Chlorobiota bacterium]
LASQYSPTGSLIWAFRYLPPYPWIDERAYSITYQPFDGTYAITGITNRFTGPAGPYQVFVMKITSGGIPIWYKGYSPMPGAPSQSRKIIAMPDGGFVITGFSTAYDPFGDVYTFRITSAGAIVWSNTYGMPGISELSESIIYQASDMSLVYTGAAAPSGTEDVILAKITAAAGLPVWTKRYPNTAGSDRGYDLKEASTPVGYSATGRLFHPTSASDDPLFLKTDAFGNVTAVCQDSTFFQPRPGYWTGDCARQPFQLSDVQITPQVTNPTPVERALCGTVTGISSYNETPNRFALKQNYPNPFNPTTVIEFSIPENSNVSISVYDASGKEVAVLVNGFKTKGNHSVDFNASNFSSGVYFYKLKADGFEETKKMLLVK